MLISLLIRHKPQIIRLLVVGGFKSIGKLCVNLKEMAQEAGGLDDISSTPTSSSTSGAGDSSSLVNGGDSPIKRTVSPAAGVVVGVAERNSKTGVSLTISPPTSLDLEGAGAHCVGLTGDYEATGEVVARSNNGSISSDIVFVDCSVAAAAALRAKGPVLSTHEEEVSIFSQSSLLTIRRI